MRREFSEWLTSFAGERDDVVVLTGDLGFGALEPVQARLGARFVNAGVSEQNMVSVASGLASTGLTALCYSIAPFAVFRPAEQIRLDVCLHGLNVKIVGNGGGYGYGIMGSTHHAIEDIGVLSTFAGMRCYVPVTGPDVAVTANAMMAVTGPGYLRLNLGTLPDGFTLSESFAPVRKLNPDRPNARVTVIALGPIILGPMKLLTVNADIDWFVVSQVPVPELSDELVASIRRTQNVVFIEEHVERGGLAEHLALKFLKGGLSPRVTVRTAQGYPSKTYGSQAFHQRESGIDAESMALVLKEHLRSDE